MNLFWAQETLANVKDIWNIGKTGGEFLLNISTFSFKTKHQTFKNEEYILYVLIWENPL